MSTLSTPAPESIRKEHLSHEASIRSIGLLYYVGAIFCVIAGAASFVANEKVFAVRLGIAGILVVLGVLYILVGRWLRALDPRAKTPVTILSILGLLGFPIGTLISIYVLYLVHSKKGAMVFSEEYKAVIAATPTMKYKTSLLVWFFLGLLILVLAGAILAALFAH